MHGVVYFFNMETPSYAAVLTHYLSLGTIIGGVVVVVAALYIFSLLCQKKENTLMKTISSYILPLGFFVSFAGAFLSLFYSEVLHYAPCDLCWFQRIFLYPQLFMFGYAWYKKDRSVLPYSLILSILGLAIALYHHALQMGYDLMKPCSSAPFAVDCSKPSFIEFGFVTFPFMAVVLFGFLAVVTFTALQRKK